MLIHPHMTSLIMLSHVRMNQHIMNDVMWGLLIIQQIASYNLLHDDSAELMFIVYVMMQHIMNDVMWGVI
jgi:hypothetical protein